MSKVFISTGTLYLDDDRPILPYTVVVIARPNTLFGGTYTLDPQLSMDDNMIALMQQVCAQAKEKGVEAVAADLGGVVIRPVTDADLAREIVQPVETERTEKGTLSISERFKRAFDWMIR